ncbi:MAG: hypothetical protein WD638_11575 [Nitriliruptoraceae bacterium]
MSVVRYLSLATLGLLVACSGGDLSVTAAEIEPIAAGAVSPDDEVDEPEGSDDPVRAFEDAPAMMNQAPPEDPFALADPADVDVEYVDRVMAALLAVSNDVLDDVLASDLAEGLTEEDIARIRAVHSGPRLMYIVNASQRRATDEGPREAFLKDDARTGVQWDSAQVLASDPACVVAIGHLDVSGTAVVPYPDDERMVVVLAAMDPEQRAEHVSHNPTPWRMHELESLTVGDPRVPVPEEQWPDLDYAGVLDLPCEEAAL